MEYTKNAKGDCILDCEIKIEPETIGQKRQKLIEEIKSNHNIPGYRKGKAPNNLISAKFNEYIEQSIREEILSDFYKKLTDDNVKPVNFDIVNSDLKKGEFKIEVEFIPDIAIDNYKGVEIEEVKVDVSDENIDSTYNNIMLNLSTWEEHDKVEEDVLINLIEFTEDIQDDEKKYHEKFPIIYSADKKPKKLYEKLKDVEIGKEYDLDIEFSEDEIEKYKNKKVKFSFKVESLKKRKKPEENEELFSKIIQDAKTKEDVYGKLREDLEKNSKSHAKNHSIGHIYENLIKNNNIPVPEKYFERVKNEQLQKEKEEYRKKYGVNFEETPEILENFAEKVIFDIKVDLIRASIEKTEKIEISEEEIEKFAMEIAQANRFPPENVKTLLKKKNEFYENIKEVLLNEKIDDLLYENAKIKYVKAEEHKHQ